jgi:hypothetical protein
MVATMQSFNSIVEGLSILQQEVSNRDTKGGTLFWSVSNAKCQSIAEKLVKLGHDKDEIHEILEGSDNWSAKLVQPYMTR